MGKKLIKDGVTGRVGGEVDAKRHCFMFCCLSKTMGKDAAIDIGDIHEDENPPRGPGGGNDPPVGWEDFDKWQKDDRKMDDNNNRVGADLGAGSPDCDCQKQCEKAHNNRRLRVNAKDGYKWPGGGDGGGSGSK